MAETLEAKRRGKRNEASSVGTGKIINGYVSTIQISLKIQQIVSSHS